MKVVPVQNMSGTKMIRLLLEGWLVMPDIYEPLGGIEAKVVFVSIVERTEVLRSLLCLYIIS